MSDYSDSDSDYNENEKILLDKFRKRKYESEDEDDEAVFNVAPDDEEDSDDNEDILADSDIEGQEDDDDLPDEKAWGRSKKNFYTSDYVNANTEKEKDLEFAELEAEAAKKLEAEIFQQLDALDTDFYEQDQKGDDDEEEDNDLNEKELRKAKEEEETSSNLTSDFKEYTEIYQKFLRPFKIKAANDESPNSKLMEFVQIFSEYILNYNINISMYFLLKAEKVKTNIHPIMERLQQYQETIEKLKTIFEEKIKDKIEAYISEKDTISVTSGEPKKKKLKLLQNLVLQKPTTKNKREPVKGSIQEMVKITEKIKNNRVEEEEEKQENEEVDELVKRPITYQIAKNKGLTPHRKKEQRNPRVKHRNKYKKAKIRRKGAVREVRKETTRYGGEISGINANVVKGIKLKV